MKNKYIKGTHISERKFRDILRHFSLDIEAEKTAILVGISRPTINKFYRLFRERIAEICEAESPFENGEIELDESYFGARRVRGKPNEVVRRSQYRYNCRHKNLYLNLLKEFRNNPLKLS